MAGNEFTKKKATKMKNGKAPCVNESAMKLMGIANPDEIVEGNLLIWGDTFALQAL